MFSPPACHVRFSKRTTSYGLIRGTTASGGLRQRGKVESVQFYESGVGQPNKSIVTFSDAGSTSKLLVLVGVMRNALPVGQKVDVTFRKESGHNVLVDVDYA